MTTPYLTDEAHGEMWSLYLGHVPAVRLAVHILAVRA
jgi:hypothetical protein